MCARTPPPPSWAAAVAALTAKASSQLEPWAGLVEGGAEKQRETPRQSLFPCVSARAGLACDEQRVLFNGKQLEDSDLLSLAGVKDEATLNILGRLLGGAKKRKKKTYTKPKKQKHKHKKIKLRVLKFYKVRCSSSRSFGQAALHACALPTLCCWRTIVCSLRLSGRPPLLGKAACTNSEVTVQTSSHDSKIGPLRQCCSHSVHRSPKTLMYL